jgi:hypothetical protein
VIEIWDVEGYPLVKAYAPNAYKLRGKRRGLLLSPVLSTERKALLGLKVRRVELPQR